MLKVFVLQDGGLNIILPCVFVPSISPTQWTHSSGSPYCHTQSSKGISKHPIINLISWVGPVEFTCAGTG